MLKEIAAQLGVSESQIRKWKNQDQWEKVTLPKSKSNVTKKKKGAQSGNHNATGNKGGAAPERNVNAVKHGAYQTIYAAYLPEEEKELYEQMPGDANLEEEIRLLRLKLARLLSREHDFFYDGFGIKHEKEISEEDREVGILACMKQLEKLIKTQDQVKRSVLDEEEQRERIEKIKAETKRIKEDKDTKDMQVNIVMSSEVSQYAD